MATLDKPEHDSNPFFIHGAADDHGLAVEPWRVLTHIARRAGSGTCFASVPSMARVCKVKEKTVRKSVKLLSELEIITVVRQPGHRSEYRINPVSRWKQPLAPNDPTPLGLVLPQKGRHPRPQTTPHPSPLGPSKVTPLQVTPPEVTPNGAGLTFPLHLNSPVFLKAFTDWMDYYPTVKRGKKSTFTKTFQYQLDKKLSPLTEPEAIRWIEEAIANRWQGLFPPRQQQNFQNQKSQPMQERNYDTWKQQSK